MQSIILVNDEADTRSASHAVVKSGGSNADPEIWADAESRLCETAQHARLKDADGPLSTKQTGRSSHAVCTFKPSGRAQLKWEAAYIFITIEVSSKKDAPDLGSLDRRSAQQILQDYILKVPARQYPSHSAKYSRYSSAIPRVLWTCMKCVIRSMVLSYFMRNLCQVLGTPSRFCGARQATSARSGFARICSRIRRIYID